MSLTIDDIVRVFEAKGHEQYDGEPVTQLQHALQSAHLAEQAGSASALITAALLHDLGHLLHDFGATPSKQGLDDLHQYRCLPFLRATFGPQTLEPIRLHVDAKRYLCAVAPGYYDTLSADSRRSLVLQGGVFDQAQAQAFGALPFAQDAVDLRRWDDAAKSADAVVPPLAHFVRHMERSAAAAAPALAQAT
ncbi:phosphonate degradation HD-domain oxygenase [Variovorax sp.]|uniref:phosphonate degradation HD-domain oxygenase n=1 Tax=Variovorax sp. TaxID=1871043 RepID=UPI002D65EB2C|nr:phosphonate degradation HD-domain oxygenase [Variovorax sp.]HYP82003.1 phosphohydrolase [Variovorax sp.]